MNNLFTRFPCRLILLCVVLLRFQSIPVAAGQFSPRVVSEHNADAYSMKTFARFSRWKDLKGDERAWSVYTYLTDRRTGLYPSGGGAWEGKDETYDFGLIRDPVKIINVYGTGYCDVFGPVMAGIWQEAGFGPARTVDLPDWSHVVAEVFYNDRWHYLDLDLRAAFRRNNGSLASLEEARTDASLWKFESSPRFFPMDDVAKVRAIYAKTSLRHRYGVHTSGHTMDYVLRQGETFTRWWTPQNDRWNHHSSYHKKESLIKLLETEPKGPKSKHASFTVHTHGNGRFVYHPNLTKQSTDFADGVYDSANVRTGKKGLTLEKAGEGFAIFEVRSPYVIVPSVGDLKKTDDDKQASVIELNGKGVTASLSRDNGATWEPLTIKKLPAVVDLTEQTAGTYGYLLKISLKGKSDEEVVLSSLKLTTWVQVAPASLPSLRKGINRMEFRSGDHYGLQTRLVEYRFDSSDETSFFKQMVIPPSEYDPKHRSLRVKGAFVIRATAAPGTKIAWFSAGGSFATFQKQAAEKTRNSIAYSVDGPTNFKEIYKAEIPTDVEHWHYNAAREIRLDQPAETIYFRYVGDPAVNAVRIYAHCIENNPRPVPAVKITHIWRENGERKTFSTTLEKPGSYEINVAGDPVDDSIELTVPTSPLRKQGG